MKYEDRAKRMRDNSFFPKTLEVNYSKCKGTKTHLIKPFVVKR
jgi:hypothetical protein